MSNNLSLFFMYMHFEWFTMFIFCILDGWKRDFWSFVNWSF